MSGRSGMDRSSFVKWHEDKGVFVQLAGLTYDLWSCYYPRDQLPHPLDSFGDMLMVDGEEIEDQVLEAFKRLNWPEPTKENPEYLPDMVLLKDFTLYLQAKSSSMSQS